jgi:hypothetical protein
MDIKVDVNEGIADGRVGSRKTLLIRIEFYTIEKIVVGLYVGATVEIKTPVKYHCSVVAPL